MKNTLLALVAVGFLGHASRLPASDSNAPGNDTMPNTRYWWQADANQNGEYNYSTTAMANGSSLQVANQWGDVPLSVLLTGPYGDTKIPAISLHFQHNGKGYAEANLTTTTANVGLEATSFTDRDTGKAVSTTNTTLNFDAPEHVDGGVRLKLVDQNGRSSASIDIKDYRSDYGRYFFAYTIPTTVFMGPEFDFNHVKSVTFYVDSSTVAGDYQLSVFNILFQRN